MICHKQTQQLIEDIRAEKLMEKLGMFLLGLSLMGIIYIVIINIIRVF